MEVLIIKIEWIILIIGFLAYIAYFVIPEHAVIVAVILAIISIISLSDALFSKYRRNQEPSLN